MTVARHMHAGVVPWGGGGGAYFLRLLSPAHCGSPLSPALTFGKLKKPPSVPTAPPPLALRKPPTRVHLSSRERVQVGSNKLRGVWRGAEARCSRGPPRGAAGSPSHHGTGAAAPPLPLPFRRCRQPICSATHLVYDCASKSTMYTLLPEAAML